MAGYIPINGPIEASKTYVDNQLAARDVTFSLPEVTAITADIEATGTMSFPIWARVENMETTITKVGQDVNFGLLIEPKMKTIEHRWAQSQIDSSGNVKTIGCKAFLRCIPTTVPGIEAVLGEATENEIVYTVTRYNLFVDGKELLLIDKLSGTIKFNGKDYSSGAKNLL